MLDLQQVYNTLFDYYGPQYWWPADSNDEIIIGAILTQNTNWKNVELAINNLKNENSCSLEDIKKISDDLLSELIKPSGFYNIKCKRLKDTASALCDLNGVEFPDRDLRNFILSIKGIGPETADSILLYAYKKPFFVIDAYTKRLLNRLDNQLNYHTYQDYQNFIMSHLEKDCQLFNEFHALIVVNAKNACRVKPKCNICPLVKLCNFGCDYESINSKS